MRFLIFLKSVLFDIKSSFGNLNFNLKDIILYRFFQYYGSYKGNKMKNKLSLHTKESYFYPTLKKGKALKPVQNIEEDFSELSQNKVVALLPMKAHSERIPNKNFKQLNGKPLLDGF